MTDNAKATEFTLKATTNEVPVVKILCSADAEKFARQFYHDDIAIYERVYNSAQSREHDNRLGEDSAGWSVSNDCRCPTGCQVCDRRFGFECDFCS